jgi:hypothetical protein
MLRPIVRRSRYGVPGIASANSTNANRGGIQVAVAALRYLLRTQSARVSRWTWNISINGHLSANIACRLRRRSAGASIVMFTASKIEMDPTERAVRDDLSKLTAEEQHAYYLETCEDLGLDPATFPLRWIVVDGRLALAAETCIGATASETPRTRQP